MTPETPSERRFGGTSRSSTVCAFLGLLLGASYASLASAFIIPSTKAGYRGARTIIHAGPPETDTEAGSTFIPDIKARVVNELRPGVVLVAKPWEYNHFYNKACLFVYQVDADKGCRAVIMEKPTAFTLSDLAPSLFSESPFAGNTIFLGGDYGGDMAIVLHPYPHIQGARPVGGGIYYGGLSAAEALIRQQDESVSLGQFKFFFNYGEWAPGMLEKEIASGKWDLVELEASSILRQGAALEERTLWPFIRRHYLPREEGLPAETEGEGGQQQQQ